MRGRIATATATLALMGAGLAASPAHASDYLPRLVWSNPACGTLTVTFLGGGDGSDLIVTLEEDSPQSISPGQTLTFSGLGSGRYTWHLRGQSWDSGSASVAACRGISPRPAPGDLTGDGRADVLAITNDGRLMFYRTNINGTLASGVQVGRGWSRFRNITRVPDGYGAGKASGLLALRDDGTLWGYPVTAYGKVGTGKLLRSDVAKYRTVYGERVQARHLFGLANDGIHSVDHHAAGPVEEVKPLAATARHLVWHDVWTFHQGGSFTTVQPDGTLWSHFEVYDPEEGGHFTDAAQAGRGWGAMDLVQSPGSMIGDAKPDLVARRTDGHLYIYLNRSVPTSGGCHAGPEVGFFCQPPGSITATKWGAGIQIGRNWNGIRLLF